MINRLKKQKLAFITVTYWFLLIYIVAALVWWFIALETQNNRMYGYRVEELHKEDPAYNQKLAVIREETVRKTAQYVGEGSTFFVLIVIGAIFVYRAVRKQIRLSQQQQNFMMAVTHELKTPIAVTRLNLETLQRRKLDEAQQQKLLSNAILETYRLNELTNNILIASQLDSGNYSLNKQVVNLSELTRHCADEFVQRFPQRTIRTNINEDVMVEGEATLLQLLLNNLVGNAIKYSAKDKSVTIMVSSARGKALIEVADEGEGVSDAEKKKIFEKFYRSGNENTRSAKGTGLGLYLCRKIVSDHRGFITVRDNQPQGSVFSVTL
ncbi:MAG TPA: ATP-binding protein [Panacibacter sp.]|nr:ATP-binding protein [Panacibacter sp.]HNP43238.1 ATP-binding protein [Panacibacter sp.]